MRLTLLVSVSVAVLALTTTPALAQQADPARLN